MADLAVISQHERGFWQADFYLGASNWTYDDWACGVSPDSFLTRPTRGEVEAAVAETWPAAEMREADDNFEEIRK